MPKFLTPVSLVALFCLVSPICLHAQTPAMPLPRGNVGIGTYATVAQFKDLSVSAGNQTLLQRSLADGLTDFTVSAGQWTVIDGALQQSSTEAKGLNIFTGDKSWTDYAVTVKARRLSGREGFSLSVRATDDKNFACLNVGGWSNTKAQFGITLNGTFSEIGSSTPFKVEDNRWYDIKIEVLGNQATGYVDNQQVARATLNPPPPAPPRGSPAPARGNVTPPRTNPAATAPAGPRPAAAPRRTGPLPDAPPINLPRIPLEEDSSPLFTVLPWIIFGAGGAGLLTAALLYARRRTAAKSAKHPTIHS